MLAEPSTKSLSTGSGRVSNAGLSTSGEGVSEEEQVLDGLAGLCLLPAGLHVEAASAAALGSVAVRHGVVEEWLTVTVAERGVISEAVLAEWLSLPSPDPQGGEDIRKFLVEKSPLASAPVCGAALLYAPVAAASWLWRPVRIFRSFYAFSSMDQGVGRAVSGLLASLLAGAVVAHPFRAGLGAWVSSTSGRLLRDLRKVSHSGSPEEAAEEARELDLLEELLWEIADRFTASSSATTGNLLEEVGRLSSIEAASRLPGAPSLVVLAVIAAALELEGKNPRAVLSLLDCPDDLCKSARTLTAGLLGAWYGRRALEEEFEGELERGEDLLWKKLRLDVAAQGALLMEVSGLLGLPDAMRPAQLEMPSSVS